MQCRSALPVTVQTVGDCLTFFTAQPVSCQALIKQSKHFKVDVLQHNWQAFAQPLVSNRIKKVSEGAPGLAASTGALRSMSQSQSESQSQLVSQSESTSQPTLEAEAQAGTLSEDGDMQVGARETRGGNLSERAERVLARSTSPYYAGWKEVARNPYDKVKNPEGCIQLGLAENTLSVDLIEEWLSVHRMDISGYPGGPENVHQDAPYQSNHGTMRTRQAFAHFMQKALRLKEPLDPEHVIVGGGCSGIIEILAFSLADHGQGFLHPSPIYPGFETDTLMRAQTPLLLVPGKSTDHFTITRENLEASFAEHSARGLTPSALLLASPNNPLGTTYTSEQLSSYLAFCKDHSLHLISDEIYAASVFSAPDFVSMLKVVGESDAETQEFARDNIHIVYGISKDLGLPGFRLGGLYTQNSRLAEAVSAQLRFCTASSVTQRMMTSLLEDDAFLDHFFEENRSRLRKRQQLLVSGLSEAGIETIPANSGLFVFANFGPFLETLDEEGEFAFYLRLLKELRINANPGVACRSAEPGWFRVCFAAASNEALETAVHRLKEFAERTQ